MYEYKVIPAPRNAPRHKGAKSTSERFAAGLQASLNELGSGGWSFVRAETLPVDERRGLWRKPVEEFHTVLIFRRPLTPHAAQNAATQAHRQPKFFAEKTPAPDSAPALGSATDSDVKVTPEIRAEKEPCWKTDAEPAARTRKKSAE